MAFASCGFKGKGFLASPLNRDTWYIFLMMDNDGKEQNNLVSRTYRVSKMDFWRPKLQYDNGFGELLFQEIRLLRFPLQQGYLAPITYDG